MARNNSNPISRNRDNLLNEFSHELDGMTDLGFTKLPNKSRIPKAQNTKNFNFATSSPFSESQNSPSFSPLHHQPHSSTFPTIQSTMPPAMYVPTYQTSYIAQSLKHNNSIYSASNPRQFSADELQAIYTNDQWKNHFERVQNTYEQTPDNDMSATAGEIINKLNAEDLPKLKDSSFVKLMKKIRDGESKIENNDFVSTETSQNETSRNVEIIDPLLRQEMTSANTKETLTDLDDEDFEHAFKFDNWVNQYESELMSLNDNPQNLDWEELRNRWGSNMNKANNPLYDHYMFTESNKYSEKSLSSIEKAMKSLNLNESLLASEAMVKTNSKDPKAWYQLGIKQQENEREPSAIAALRQSVALDENQYEAWLALAVSYTNENCRTDAYESLSKWLLYNPKYKSYHADIIFNKNDNNEALHNELMNRYLDAINQSAAKNEFDDQLQVALGVLLNLSNDYEKAIECFQTALQSRPRDYLLWNKLGATYANNHQPDKAIEAYFKALEINPSFIRARYNLAISSINLSQYNEAAEHLVTALSLQKQNKDETLAKQTGINSTSTHIWDTLRMTLFMLNRQDLLNPCDNRDLEPFKQIFGF